MVYSKFQHQGDVEFLGIQQAGFTGSEFHHYQVNIIENKRLHWLFVSRLLDQNVNLKLTKARNKSVARKQKHFLLLRLLHVRM